MNGVLFGLLVLAGTPGDPRAWADYFPGEQGAGKAIPSDLLKDDRRESSGHGSGGPGMMEELNKSGETPMRVPDTDRPTPMEREEIPPLVPPDADEMDRAGTDDETSVRGSKQAFVHCPAERSPIWNLT